MYSGTNGIIHTYTYMHMVAYRNYCMSTVLDGSLGSSWVNLLSSWNSSDSAKPSMTGNCGDTPYPIAMAASCLAHPQITTEAMNMLHSGEDYVVGLSQDRETYGCPLATRKVAEMEVRRWQTVHQLWQPAVPNLLPLLGSVFWALKWDWDLLLRILWLCPLRVHEKLLLCTASQCPYRLLPLWWGRSLWLLLPSVPLVPHSAPHRLTSMGHTGRFLATLPKDGRKSARNGREESEHKSCIPRLCCDTSLSWSLRPESPDKLSSPTPCSCQFLLRPQPFSQCLP